MPEIAHDKKIFTLLEVGASIQKTISERYKSAFWVKAEINKLNFYKHSGHCYPELVEKQDGKVIAQMNATFWAADYNRINAGFIRLLKEPLKDGIKVLMLAKISYNVNYGLTLNILDIDAAFTLGDLQREKQLTIERLQDENLFNRNKTRVLPLLPQRLAIISVETSKGYADFLRVVSPNPWQYRFFHMLFPSVLQGEKAVDGIIAQLRKIEKVIDHFDAVAIIRGGGGDVGLSCYNHYDLAKEIASFPIPVLTGIGHATNETVAELISFHNAITPTKLAEYLLQRFHDYAFPLNKAHETVIDRARRLISEENVKVQSEAKFFRSVTLNMLLRNGDMMNGLSQSLLRHTQIRFRNERMGINSMKSGISMHVTRLYVSAKIMLGQFETSLRKDVQSKLVQSAIAIANIESNVFNMNPLNVLRRGYSITTKNGKAITSTAEVSDSDVIETTLADGKITSAVKSKSKIKEDE